MRTNANGAHCVTAQEKPVIATRRVDPANVNVKLEITGQLGLRTAERYEQGSKHTNGKDQVAERPQGCQMKMQDGRDLYPFPEGEILRLSRPVACLDCEQRKREVANQRHEGGQKERLGTLARGFCVEEGLFLVRRWNGACGLVKISDIDARVEENGEPRYPCAVQIIRKRRSERLCSRTKTE
jgi:hypothetical protein